MNKKLFIFDVDDTLKKPNGELSNMLIDSLKKLQDNGHELVIATGRPIFMIQDVLDLLNISNSITFNGQYVVKNNICLNKNILNRDFILDIINDILKDDNNSFVFQNEYNMYATKENDTRIKKCFESMNFEYPIIDKNFFQNNDFIQTILFTSDINKYKNKYKNVRFQEWSNGSCDILPLNVNKWVGIKQLIEKLNYDIEDVIAFGDSHNDIEMLENVGYGIAMGNAKEDVKLIAKEVTLSLDEEGIVYWLMNNKFI